MCVYLLVLFLDLPEAPYHASITQRNVRHPQKMHATIGHRHALHASRSRCKQADHIGHRVAGHRSRAQCRAFSEHASLFGRLEDAIKSDAGTAALQGQLQEQLHGALDGVQGVGSLEGAQERLSGVMAGLQGAAASASSGIFQGLELGKGLEMPQLPDLTSWSPPQASLVRAPVSLLASSFESQASSGRGLAEETTT